MKANSHSQAGSRVRALPRGSGKMTATRNVSGYVRTIEMQNAANQA